MSGRRRRFEADNCDGEHESQGSYFFLFTLKPEKNQTQKKLHHPFKKYTFVVLEHLTNTSLTEDYIFSILSETLADKVRVYMLPIQPDNTG